MSGAKLLFVTEPMQKRVRRAKYTWSDGGRCLIDGWTFRSDECPHSILQNERVLEMVKNQDGVI